MSLNLNGNVTGVYLGSAKADAVYLGNVKVFEDVPPQETVTIGGRAYPVVTIGDQKWLAENLDLKASGIDIGPSGSPTSPAAWYYGNNESGHGVDGDKYGLLYNWYAVDLLNTNRATLFPGWHVPSDYEFLVLFNFIEETAVNKSGTKLKSTTGWSSGNGTDDFGFSAFPAGTRQDGSFYDITTRTNFWSSTTASSTWAKYWYINKTAVMHPTSTNKAYGFSVRLVKDA